MLFCPSRYSEEGETEAGEMGVDMGSRAVPLPVPEMSRRGVRVGIQYCTKVLVGEVDGSVGRTFRLEGDPAKHWQEGTEE